jgi:hypothetical protein
MKTEVKTQAVRDLRAALTFVGQAQSAIGDTLAVAKENNGVESWKKLGTLYDAVNEEIEDLLEIPEE